MMDRTLVRRISGTAAVILLVAVSYLGLKARFAPPSGSYEVTAVLGTAGSGLSEGSDVKVRGVRVGEVARLDYTDGRAIATLQFEPEPRLPAPEHLHLVVTAKTLLGEKQVEISFPDEAFGQEDVLEAGDVLVAAREPTELSAVIDAFTPFVDAIDGRDLAAIVEAFGEQQGEADVIVENLELGSRLAAFGERTAERNLANLRKFTDVSDSLTTVADDMARLNRALPEATRVLREEQVRLQRNLEALSRFSIGFAEFLEVEEPVIHRLLRSGDVIGAMFERQQDQIGLLVQGLYLYFEKFPHGLGLNDGTEAAGFRIFLDFHLPTSESSGGTDAELPYSGGCTLGRTLAECAAEVSR